MVVNFVRKHWAQPGVTVTESKFLYDAQSQIEREVDIVIEGTLTENLALLLSKSSNMAALPPSSGLNSRLISIATFRLID
jgi:hypothetical protein